MNRTRVSRLWKLAALVLVLSLVLPMAAFADTVQNDVTAALGNDTFILGKSTMVGYQIEANNGDGERGCNATSASPAIVTIVGNDSVIATPASLEFTDCDIYEYVVFTASAVGEYVITVTVSDEGVGTYNTNPAKFKLKVLPSSDTTPPVITWSSDAPVDGASYYFDFVPPLSDWECTAVDDVDGVVPCTVEPEGYGTEVGEYTLTATASDKSGNTATDKRTYTVLAWELYGFYAPADKAITVKGGSTVPLKFEVFAGELEFTDTSVVQKFSATKVACSAGSDTEGVLVENTGQTMLRYDFDEGQFIQNWKTPKAPGECYVVSITTQDGSSISVNITLK